MKFDVYGGIYLLITSKQNILYLYLIVIMNGLLIMHFFVQILQGKGEMGKRDYTKILGK